MRSLQELSDQAEIRDVLTSYFNGVDRRDWPAVQGCFTADCHCEYHGFPVEGSAALIAMIKGIERYRASMHFMGNVLIKVKGDTAESESYAQAHLLAPLNATEERVRINGLRYVDQWVRVEGEWKIAVRVQHRDWNRNDVIPALEPQARAE